MKNIVFRVALVILSSILVVIGVNYCIDPAGVYHSDEISNMMVEGLRKGKNVAVISGNLDERAFKRTLVEKEFYNRTVDFVVLGASRVFLIDSRSTLPNYEILNLGVSSAQVPDFLAFYQILKENRVKYENMIIGIEPTIFNVMDTRWKTNSFYYDRFHGVDNNADEIRMDKINNLFSISYFQAALPVFINQIGSSNKSIECVDEYEGVATIYHPDGSFCYNAKYRNKSQSEIDNAALTGNVATFTKYLDVNTSVIEDFELLLDKLIEDGVNVSFFMAPYHPLYYDRIIEQPIYSLGYNCLLEISNRNNFEIIGSYNPSDVDCNETCFYDGGHPKKEVIDKLFSDFISKQ